jgi:hypothetical protein
MNEKMWFRISFGMRRIHASEGGVSMMGKEGIACVIDDAEAGENESMTDVSNFQIASTRFAIGNLGPRG